MNKEDYSSAKNVFSPFHLEPDQKTSGHSDPKSRKKQQRNFRQNSEQAPPSQRLIHDKSPPDLREKAKNTKLHNGMKIKIFKDQNLRQTQRKYGSLKSAGHSIKYQAWRYTHSKINQAEQENVGAEAAHKTEFSAESALRHSSRFVKQHSRTRSVRSNHKEKQAIRAKADLEFQKAVKGDTDLNKNVVSRYIQKQKIRKRYLKQAQKTAKQTTKRTASLTHKVGRAIKKLIRSNPKSILVIAGVFLIMVVLQSILGAIATIGSGISGAIGGATYLANDLDITKAELIYTEWETDLEISIDNLENTQPDYDEYRYNVDKSKINHSAFELMAFLTAVYDEFTYPEIENVLREIFSEQYILTTGRIDGTTSGEAGELIGEVRTTAYCPCIICCGSPANGITSSGVKATANRTIAVDIKNPIVPMGTQIVINGITYTVEDTGNLSKSGTDFDIFFETHQEALSWGRQNHMAYYAKGDDNKNSMRQNVLEINLQVNQFTHILESKMNPEQLERYTVYLATKGNRQYLDSPFSIGWLSHVTSGFGYRTHPISGEKDYHKGVDIGMPEGTNINAGQNGTVLYAGSSEGYGLMIMIEGENGIVSRYAHCSVLHVSIGQSVQRGDVIAKVGSTGNSTGPHLHLEIMKDGQYLNPLYFAFTNE